MPLVVSGLGWTDFYPRPFFETKTSDEWVELLSGINILKAKVNTYAQASGSSLEAHEGVKSTKGSSLLL